MNLQLITIGLIAILIILLIVLLIILSSKKEKYVTNVTTSGLKDIFVSFMVTNKIYPVTDIALIENDFEMARKQLTEQEFLAFFWFVFGLTLKEKIPKSVLSYQPKFLKVMLPLLSKYKVNNVFSNFHKQKLNEQKMFKDETLIQEAISIRKGRYIIDKAEASKLAENDPFKITYATQRKKLLAFYTKLLSKVKQMYNDKVEEFEFNANGIYPHYDDEDCAPFIC